MHKIHIQDLRPHKIWGLREFIQLRLPSYAILAGGALKSIFDGKPISDFDVFVLASSNEELVQRKDKIEGKLKDASFKQIFKCPLNELSTFKLGNMKIQIVNVKHTLYDSPEAVIDRFDFNVCCMYLNGYALVVKPEAIRDLRSKTLTLNALPYPASTIHRLAKFKKQGYKTSSVAREITNLFAENIRNNVPMEMDIVYVD